MHKISSKLDWNRMLGFEQIADTRLAESGKQDTKVGAMLGAKPGLKMGIKLGLKAGLKA